MNLLKEPYQEFAWLFAWIVGQDYKVYFPWYVIFILCCTYKMGLDFEWAQIISNEISHQWENYQQTEKFFMVAYLVYAIIYNCIFEELPIRTDINISKEPVQF